MIRVAVLDDWQGIADSVADWSALKSRAEIVFFREHLGDTDQVVRALAGFDVAVAMRERTAFSAATVARLNDLRLLVYTGARNAAVDAAACTARKILVCNTATTRPSAATAELTLALMLAVAREIPVADLEMRSGRFQERVPAGIELGGRVLGLVGLGKIGATMARYGHALGMSVIAWSQNLTDARAAEAGATRVAKEELFSRADVVSVHLVLSERSRGIVGAADIARLKHGAILLNTSRGPLVDQAALLAALNERKIFAGIDVYDTEPLPADHPLRRAPNTVLTPHLGYVSVENMGDLYRDCIEDIAAWLDGKPIRMVNPEILG
jgi:phosphoglycerate dehydrogenase-like enzyme